MENSGDKIENSGIFRENVSFSEKIVTWENMREKKGKLVREYYAKFRLNGGK